MQDYWLHSIRSCRAVFLNDAKNICSHQHLSARISNFCVEEHPCRCNTRDCGLIYFAVKGNILAHQILIFLIIRLEGDQGKLIIFCSISISTKPIEIISILVTMIISTRLLLLLDCVISRASSYQANIKGTVQYILYNVLRSWTRAT